MPFLKEIKQNIWLIAFVFIYIAVNMILTWNEFYYLNFLPVLVFFIFIAFTRLDILFFIIVFLTPLSIELIEFIHSSPIDFAIPTEPLLFGVMIIFLYKLIREGNIDRRIVNHPVSYAILFYLFWIFVTAITSSMPLVSFKFLLAKVWFIVTFYLLAIFIFKKTETIPLFIWCYALPMVFIVLYSIKRHMFYGLFDKQAAHSVMGPFFRDHTSYGAILAMLFFGVGGIIFRQGKNFLLKSISWIVLFILSAGLILSYTRAAWISVLFSFGIMIVTLLKIKFRYLLAGGIFILIVFMGQRTEIVHKLEKNKQDSSADLAEHVQSISNITTDDSNLERLNRWDAAFKMFKERPVFGWGPGTYTFNYAPFQSSQKKTLISTNFGDLGNAHSEYIGPLAESGVPGSISFLLIVIISLLTGFRVYYKIQDKKLKQVVLAYILAFITYLVHGSLNNFLDTDKASALFWGFIAVFVSLDIYYLHGKETSEPGSNSTVNKNTN
ncbi:MAG: O-antigen ligase family protein [Bacteroidales bacterium]|nr:O-antigen ligase family protein [Bacteroidales bacterium]